MDYIITGIILLLAVIIIVRFLYRMMKGDSGCGSCPSCKECSQPCSNFDKQAKEKAEGEERSEE